MVPAQMLQLARGCRRIEGPSESRLARSHPELQLDAVHTHLTRQLETATTLLGCSVAIIPTWRNCPSPKLGVLLREIGVRCENVSWLQGFGT